MKPDINDYKILSQYQMYYVLDPYDLFAMPCLKLCGIAHDTLQEAELAKIQKFERDMKEYERLKALGRSFPITIKELKMNQEREDMLKKVRCNSLVNALYMIETKDELIEALSHVSSDNLIALRSMCDFVLDEKFNNN